MKPKFPPIAAKQKLTQLDPSTYSGLVEPLQLSLDQIKGMLGNGLLIGDNFNAAKVTLGALPISGKPGAYSATMTSGVEYLFANHLVKGSPAGFEVWSATDSSGNPIAVSSVKFNNSRTDNLIGITVLQETSGPYLEVVPNTNQSLSGGVRTAIIWDGTSVSDSTGVISITSSTHIYVSQPGLYQFSGQLVFSLTTTGYRGAWTAKNGTNDTTRGNTFAYPNQNDITALNYCAVWPLVAGDYVEVYGTQTTVGNLTIRGTPSSTFISDLQVTRIGPNPSSLPTMLVTGVIWGG